MTNTFLAKAKCFLFDMDGTLYLGERVLPGARELLNWLIEQRIPYFLLTNNSSRSSRDYFAKVQRLGLPVGEQQIFTSGEATAIFLNRHYFEKRVYVVGTPSLESEFVAHGIHLRDTNPDVVVLGFDTTLTYAKLQKLCDFIRAGIPYIATHPDINCPTESGFMPDIGAMMALVAASTNRTPDVVIGKPNAPIVEAICEKTGYTPPELVMVGDRLYTDIAMGQTGLKTVLVLSGETKLDDVKGSAFKPDMVVQDAAELLKLLQG